MPGVCDRCAADDNLSVLERPYVSHIGLKRGGRMCKACRETWAARLSALKLSSERKEAEADYDMLRRLNGKDKELITEDELEAGKAALEYVERQIVNEYETFLEEK